MELETILHYFTEYGPFAIYVIVLLEYLNLPGFPAGVIMPLAGVFAAQGRIGFIETMVITVLAGLTGSVALYVIGRYGGEILLEKYYKHFPSQRTLIEEKIAYLKEKGCAGVFVSKLMPVVRTLISIPAGVIKMNFQKYCFSSALGVLTWNLAFVGAGYFLGDKMLGYLQQM